MENYFEGEKIEFWKGKKVLITGIDGFIGSNLAKELVERSAFVVGIIRNPLLNNHSLSEKITKIPGDITNLELVHKTMSQYEIDTVFHLAALSLVTNAIQTPGITLRSNILGTINILEAARNSKFIERIIITSSGGIYGKQKSLPYTEENISKDRSPYSTSKICSEIISESYWRTYNLPIGITRFFNVYGEGDLNFSRIIPGTIKSIIENKKPVLRNNGLSIRQYIYVKDAVEGYLTFAEKLNSNKLWGEIINFSSRETISARQLVEKILQLSRSTLKLDEEGIIKGEIDKQYLSSEKAERLLEWTTKVKLEDGLNKTIKWYKNYFKKRKFKI